MDPIIVERDPVFDASVHTIVPLEKVADSDADAIATFQKELQAKGWCIVRFPQGKAKEEGRYWERGDYHAIAPTKKEIDTLSEFFQQEAKTKEGSTGYSAVDHKESIHVITPMYTFRSGKNQGKSKDSAMDKLLDKWAGNLDEVVVDLLEVIAKKILNISSPTLGHRADLPLSFGGQRGMLDIAYYLNKKTVDKSDPVGYSTEEVNCVPHYDPGFFSLSFLSTHDGLQLQDPATGKWYAGPVNTRPGQEALGVIWLGDAASRVSNGTLKNGIHRVVYPRDPVPRVTAWYEVCTVEQINQDQNPQPMEGEIKLPNLPGSKPLQVAKGEKEAITRRYGIPMSKVMRRSDRWAAAYSEDYKREKAKQKGKTYDPNNDFDFDFD
jgi:isopenicillin N synthase-like dioxygenase